MSIHPRPRSHPLSSLATKIILFVFASTFATALVVSWVSIQSTHASLRGVVDRLYPLSLEQAESRAGPWLEAAHAEIEGLAGDPALARGARAHRRLEEVLHTSAHWTGLARVSDEGVVLSAAGEVPDTVFDAPRDPARDPEGFPMPALRVPLAHGGQLLGLLDRSSLDTLLQAHVPDPTTVVALVDADGRVLAASSPKGSLSPSARLGPPESAARSAPPTSTVEYFSGDEAVIGASRPVGRSGWRLVVQAPFHAAFAPVLDVVSRIFLIDLGVILLFSFLAYRVTSTIVRPIERLSDWARRIAQGQIDLEIPETGGRDEIGLLARTFNDMMRQLRRNQEEIETANHELRVDKVRLQQANEVLNQLSITDGLTKLHNHRFFQDHLTREIKRVSRSGEPLSMLLIDIDDFKKLNDRFGHAAGDELLTRMAPILNNAVREADLVARYGGEEFVVLALNTDVHGAYALAEKIRTAIAESSFILDDSLRPLRVTVSIGVAQYGGNRKRFFQKADEALYRAKADGKNCTVMDGDDAEDAPQDPPGE